MNSDKTKYFFLIIVLISCYSCLERADYNLPLFVFAYILWDHDNNKKEQTQRIRFTYFFLYSIFLDICWIIIWSVIWFSEDVIETDSVVFHICIVCASILELILKILLIAIILRENESIQNSMPLLSKLCCLKRKE